MFYRIFYTSWPQLLEAGRGGFGIVARHREIPTVISHAAEAASQFAPLRGEAVHRVVYAYRTETAQSGRWHILSRIEDSGSDYTGRTNYLAQHLVASDEVARSLASQGISPAMVMGAPDAWRISTGKLVLSPIPLGKSDKRLLEKDIGPGSVMVMPIVASSLLPGAM